MNSKLDFNILLPLIFIFTLSTLSLCTTPNFIFILTDDQDIALGGLNPLVKTQLLIGKHGAEFSNMFVTTPLCCPSRASILTGKYAHNHGVRNNSINGNCNSLYWQIKQEKSAFITHFKKAGYSTFYSGKYLNQYGDKSTGDVKHIPPGWDQWIALVGNSRYYNYSLSVNGKRVKHGSDPEDYFTNVIVKKALNFLNLQNQTSPFFMFLSPPAPHAPFTPFPTYRNKFSNLSAPRTPNFGIAGGKDKHWLLRQPPERLQSSVIKSIDDVFRNRWRTLLSVDDGIEQIYLTLKKKGLLENTYIFVTSDNGFHLGQFSLPWDKRQLYEFDVRVPLIVRGPKIYPGLQIQHPVLNIDLAPTFLELARLTIPKDMDGESFAHLIKHSKSKVSSSLNIQNLGQRLFIIEHQGESAEKPIPGCPQYMPKEVNTCEIDCICEDSKNNTYICVRQLTDIENFIACSFKDDENFKEAYNLTEDPFQLKNIISVSEKTDSLLTQLRKLFF